MRNREGVPLRIGLLWHSASSGNLGVGALTLANLRIAREVAAELDLVPHFTIIGMRDGEQVYIHEEDVDSFIVDSRSLLSPNGCWSVLRSLDCVLDIGGGDSFAEIYGAKRFGFLWLTKMLAAAAGTPYILSPQTIGPFTKQPYRTLAKAVLERADLVVARDSASFEFLRTLAPKARAALSTDVAFALPFEDRGRERGAGPLRVGLNVSGLLYADAVQGVNRFALGYDYAKLTRRLLEELTGRGNLEVHLFAHVVASGDKGDSDGELCDRLWEQYPGSVRVPNFAGPSEAKTYISGLDFVIAGRMHACIAAFSTGVPVVPVAYSRKFVGLFGSLKYEWIVPPVGLGTEEALAFVLDCLQKREILRTHVAESMQQVEGLLGVYRRELSRFLQSVVA